jgi:Putative peptidoglycan binding domain/D-alanyl-D-alanine carboxypeptidase
MIKTIKRGSRGPHVRTWQTFLRGSGDYLGASDGQFGPKTEAATRRFQKDQGLDVDGVVGNHTWGWAMAMGLEMVEDDSKDKRGANWPPVPTSPKPAKLATRQKLFGKFDYRPAPTKGNPEGIKILGSWQRDHLTRVTVPQLKGVFGAPKSGRIFWHEAAKDQLLDLFQAWEDANLILLVKSWAGSWNPRFIRGSRTSLSNHAWATAFDINVPNNGLGRRPALVGDDWSVRELVPLANKFGFFWGGHWGPAFGGRRADGMHFEVAKIP